MDKTSDGVVDGVVDGTEETVGSAGRAAAMPKWERKRQARARKMFLNEDMMGRCKVVKRCQQQLCKIRQKRSEGGIEKKEKEEKRNGMKEA